MRFTIIVIDNVTGYRREIQTDAEPEWLHLLRSPQEFVEEAKRTQCVDSPTDQHGYECVLCGHSLGSPIEIRG